MRGSENKIRCGLISFSLNSDIRPEGAILMGNGFFSAARAVLQRVPQGNWHVRFCCALRVNNGFSLKPAVMAGKCGRLVRANHVLAGVRYG